MTDEDFFEHYVQLAKALKVLTDSLKLGDGVYDFSVTIHLAEGLVNLSEMLLLPGGSKKTP